MTFEQDKQAIINALQSGDLALQGQFVLGSNYTFLVEAASTDVTCKAVYKPSRGERPLWDFPARTLAKRETAAYLISEALGWELVPPTVYRRRNTPLGTGSVQLFVEHDPDYHYFTFTDEDRQRLRPAALFDILVNNADRKGGHILIDTRGHIWLIDQGLCFHHEDKLRTILWDFAGETVPEELLEPVERLVVMLEADDSPGVFRDLARLISPAEIRAMCRRGRAILQQKVFPLPSKDHRPYPWPPL